MILLAHKVPLALEPTPKQSAWGLIGWLVLCGASAATGAFVSTGTWYQQLSKPTWNPPSWIFGPVWTLLYILMAVAAWLVWREGGWKIQRGPLSLFMAQWLLNALWTPLFFGLHRLGLALVDIVALVIVLACTVWRFGQVKRKASLLLLPYLGWVGFAACLNFTLWKLNPGVSS